jgi:asparagine synthase (glutamine-hydrolysing)
MQLYKKKGPHFIDEMNRFFQFAIYDVEKKDGRYFVTRDHGYSIIHWLG